MSFGDVLLGVHKPDGCHHQTKPVEERRAKSDEFW
jgi:hypothetical protein